MKDKVIGIVSRIMQVRTEHLDEHSSPDTIQQWDSLKHMSLLLALEEEFDVHFDDEELLEMMSVRAIMDVLQRHLKQS